ncbi:MAG: ABC transporter ATP-binding protein [Spirochaetia bacterium]|nr:ABC transporter ATP-binding protein [Spirochaetia bacterium]
MSAVISIQNLYKSFGEKKVLKGASLQVNNGEIMYVIGKSGSGKSVLLKHITGLMRPDSGKVYIEDEEIFSLSEKDLMRVRMKMGVLFQMAALFDSMTVFENVAFTLRRFTNKKEEEIKSIVSEKLSLVGLKSVEDFSPSTLSGGMQKRVGLARAIALQPKIVLYDEPTTGVDPILASAVDDLIMTLNKELNVTTLVISHDMKSTFHTADRVAMLYEGDFILTGEPEAFKESKDPVVYQFVQGMAKGPISIL